MAFLDNSGDIILDAVLTDTGRYRLAKGDGSFKIAKFALGDDEIDYSIYDPTAASAYTDLAILQTPVLEAFTNNDSMMKSTLLSISNENLLYLPILKLNEKGAERDRHANSMFTVSVNKDTSDAFADSFKVMNGYSPQDSSRVIRIDQGIDNLNIPATRTLESDLVETQYLITLDNRFGSVISPTSTSAAPLSFVDDDNIANYFLTTGNREFVTTNANTNVDSTEDTISGTRGTTAKFRLQASLELLGGAYFDDMGGTVTMSDDSGTSVYKYVDSICQIKGLTTGYRIDLPIRWIRAT
jgi:hypothetical protein|tara:strand:- start:310 stop:1203 length:894 start_codon:yes stop_codon:yes gene_type:complete